MVSDYWREYDERPYLTRLYDARWIERSLFMDTTHDDPALNTYITNIIRSTDARALLQFNRIDFRFAVDSPKLPNCRADSSVSKSAQPMGIHTT